ncbi:TonB-dependent receptor domain-containing protein [Flavobacterium wongokense]|uniref:TonB-dependent receptor domain-containing protein n=1 Tax=Flavobacterium wongokense TaxID=2910674 RepID=UPI001F257E24|nr:TonB-dependent receptor [Flavobacterium sp. WG47]MCF6132271.1 TonB-dependent receptor [Flavobacterium sp. WG47]
MKKFHFLLSALSLFFSITVFGQETRAGGERTEGKPERAKITITGKISEKTSKLPLEYATVTFKNSKNPKAVFGGITDNKGDYSVEVTAGTYDITFEFISFKPTIISGKQLNENTNLGNTALEEDAQQLQEVVVRAEKSTVEIKLDKKVYNVGQDMMVKGGTASDVLDNVPSVTVDAEGNVALRGNENVKVLIDGRPSNAINVADALKSIPADALDKVEVITNPSARYNAEGGGGIINILLKKGKNLGLNGTVVASTGYPETYGLTGTINYKAKEFNLFTTQGYNYRNNPGQAFTNSRFLNDDNSTRNFMNENRENERLNKSYNANLGMDWYLDKSTTWTNTFNYRRSNGDNRDNVFQNYYDVNHLYTSTTNRINNTDSESRDVEFTTNLTKNFKKEGHKLTIDGAFSSDHDLDLATINETNTLSSGLSVDETVNNQHQSRNTIQADYVLPLGKGSQFEAGYRGDFSKNLSDYSVSRNGEIQNNYTNSLEYKEKVNALYTQYGFKINKFSTLLGLRWEDSDIDVNQLATADFTNKKYNNFFPSAFFTYEIDDKSSASISFSRRIQRPRGRQLNPFNNLSSNVNIFVGNPDLNPAYTNAIDLGYIRRWDKLTFNTSLYGNKTTDVFQQVRIQTDTLEDGTPVITTTPINLATEYRSGFEFTLNYSPYKWWKLNSNFNFFYIKTDGDYSYIDTNNVEQEQDFDFETTSWFTRLTSKVTLPYKIDWQTNMNYQGAQKNRQGSSLGNFSMNLALSKDILKDKGTIAFNVSDVFNSRKRIQDTFIDGTVESHSEMQWRKRQFNLSFTYRFNVQKSDREKEKRKQNQQQGDDNGDFQG